MYEDRTYNVILSEAQAMISDDIQKEEGSLVYNALSALAFEIEKLYIQADFILRQSCAETADFEHLKLRASDRGIYPYEATNVQAKGKFNVEVPIGTRFNCKAYNYTVIEKIAPMTYVLQCEESGIGPNGLLGELTPISFVEGLETAELTEILVPGRDDEKKESLYKRYLESFRSGGFGGNVAAYKTHTNELPGVGGCRIFPVWDGPGTVKVVVIGADFRKISDFQIEEIREDICPQESQGYGFAPIDHDVTIESVEEIEISISTSLTFENGYSWEILQDTVLKEINHYFEDLRKRWGEEREDNRTIIYIARLESVILDVYGILDVQDTHLNGQGNNLMLESTQIPVLHEVISRSEV